VTAALTLHYNKAMFILEPTEIARKLARKRVAVCEYPDGRLEIQHEGYVLPYRPFDKMRQVNQTSIVENKHLDAALLLAKQIQAIAPHHRKRNNDAPARKSQPAHLFPEPEVPPKIDRRRMAVPKLKRGPGSATPSCANVARSSTSKRNNQHSRPAPTGPTADAAVPILTPTGQRSAGSGLRALGWLHPDPAVPKGVISIWRK
jgi:hypothetical protein